MDELKNKLLEFVKQNRKVFNKELVFYNPDVKTYSMYPNYYYNKILKFVYQLFVNQHVLIILDEDCDEDYEMNGIMFIIYNLKRHYKYQTSPLIKYNFKHELYVNGNYIRYENLNKLIARVVGPYVHETRFTELCATGANNIFWRKNLILFFS